MGAKQPGAWRGVVFDGGITPHLTAQGVTSDLIPPPKILTATPCFEVPKNYRYMLFIANHFLL